VRAIESRIREIEIGETGIGAIDRHHPAIRIVIFQAKRPIAIGGDEIGIRAMDGRHPASRIVSSEAMKPIAIRGEEMRIGVMDRRHPASRIVISGMPISRPVRGMRIDSHLPCVPS